ncbi:hypothetical protein [Brevifollis gellanilyticus]|uniref:Uncharacterized protein n=1 Tax=Brevifollis gellanilyticus TaxID=748831 RepID=A0A512MBZ1_9BACT|nr:hypothetical protein [Brevifollis gellanilyticus]GEP44246.1 hypothetical protein BGE01nite_35370 [Brevifollis gellanilyticus]
MKTFSHLPLAFGVIAAFFGAVISSAAAPCDDIARDVSLAVEKEPGKVLMIVEDALVINESCACEITRAAILSAKADATLVNQIVQTAIAVAPKMSGVIMDCATAVAPSAAATPQPIVMSESGKDVKNPVPLAPAPVVVEEDYIIPASIRGIYLLQPPAGGFPPGKKRCKGNGCISPYINLPFYP